MHFNTAQILIYIYVKRLKPQKPNLLNFFNKTRSKKLVERKPSKKSNYNAFLKQSHYKALQRKHDVIYM